MLDKPKEVNAALVRIIGLDRSQFSQIAMIAQGEFLKLLTAGNKGPAGDIPQDLQDELLRGAAKPPEGQHEHALPKM